MSRIKVFTIRQIPFPPETCALLAASCTQLVSLAIDCPYSQADDCATCCFMHLDAYVVPTDLLPLTQLTKLTHLSCEFLPCPDMVLETLLSALPSLSSLCTLMHSLRKLH